MARIMIVDDAAFMRKILADILTKAGHHIVGEAENAKEAISLYEKHKPDVVTMDIIMPEMDGLDGIGGVKKILARDPQAKIIVVSAMGQQRLVVEAIQAGAKDYIIKPFQPSNISEAVARLTKKAA